MGVHLANGGMRGHGTGDPIEATTDLWFHWGDKGIDEGTPLNDTQSVTVQSAAATSQSAFDTAAGNVASWYAMSSLSTAEKAHARERIRAGVVKYTAGPRP
jgi:hypothetical protein